MIVQDVDAHCNVNSKSNNVMNQNNVQESFEGVVEHFQMGVQDYKTTCRTD